MNVDPEYYLVRFSEQYAIVCAIINSEKEEQYHFLGGVCDYTSHTKTY